MWIFSTLIFFCVENYNHPHSLLAEAKVNTMKASYEASVNATMQSYNSMLEQNKRIDSLMNTMAELTGTTIALEAKLAAVETGIDSSERKLTQDINDITRQSLETSKQTTNVEEAYMWKLKHQRTKCFLFCELGFVSGLFADAVTSCGGWCL